MVAGSQCACGRVVAPPRRLCPACRAEMTPVELDAHGTLLSFTRVHVPPEGFEPGFVIGLVGLERGAKLICHGSGKGLDTLEIGMSVTVQRAAVAAGAGDRYRFTIGATRTE